MRQLIIIGNGFDLAHGMKTSYNDFILWYLNDIVQSLVNNYKYSDDLVNISLAENFRMSETPLFTNIGEFNKIFNSFKFRASRDERNRYFKELLNAMHANWVDIEAFFFQKLIDIYKAQTAPLREKDVSKILIELNTFMEGIKWNLMRYLDTLEIAHKNEEIATHIVNKTKDIPKGYEALFLNFNYTNTLDHYCSNNINSNPHSIYIHGNISDNTNPVIFGYGDEVDKYFKLIEDTGNDLYLKNIKSYWYLRTNNYRQITDFINNGEYKVSIMGHSCGLSDRVLLSEIFTNKHCKEIDILYFDKGNGENDHIEKCYAIGRQFPNEFKGIMRSKIVPLDMSVPLVKFRNP